MRSARPPLFLLLALLACGTSKRTLYPFEREFGLEGGGWSRTIDGLLVSIEADGSTVRIRHGSRNFEFRNVRAFKGLYSYSTFEIRGDTMNAFYSPKGLTVKRGDRFNHWDPERLPEGVKIVVEGIDIRYEGLEVSASGP